MFTLTFSLVYRGLTWDDFIQCMLTALENIKDEKFRVATHFTLEEMSEPVPKKILNSVMWSFAKILTAFCPYQEKSGPAVARYISDAFDPWFSYNFPLLSSSAAATRTFKTRIHGWFLTNLKRKKPKGTNSSMANCWLSECLSLVWMCVAHIGVDSYVKGIFIGWEQNIVLVRSEAKKAFSINFSKGRSGKTRLMAGCVYLSY